MAAKTTPAGSLERTGTGIQQDPTVRAVQATWDVRTKVCGPPLGIRRCPDTKTDRTYWHTTYRADWTTLGATQLIERKST
jgi:hypothetical protein